eukprot:TRINITY_DN16022_c0_g1_i1.p1 TRINITY_DN16022_c0_g1~~TRINITY_DN16022_c0_g1_i1.p1  ORF type:complete len:1005 (+),score=104.20 TRINITY_DN16022_c0_g1_i1:42-3056(+)
MECDINAIPEKDACLLQGAVTCNTPLLVVKELVENALDSGATLVQVRLAGDVLGRIVVEDNGRGVPPGGDIGCSGWTSKRGSDGAAEGACGPDGTPLYGYRGQALFSIAAMAQGFTIHTKASSDPQTAAGRSYNVTERTVKDGTRRIPGTRAEVTGLFGHIPARAGYWKKPALVKRLWVELQQLSIAFNIRHPRVRLSMYKDDTEVARCPDKPVASVSDAVRAVLGRKVHSAMDKVSASDAHSRAVELWLPKVGEKGVPATRACGDRTFIFINGRWMHWRKGIKTVRDAYALRCPPRLRTDGKTREPACCLFLTLPAAEVDMRLSPTKMEAVFVNEQAALAVLKTALARQPGLPSDDGWVKFAPEQAGPPAADDGGDALLLVRPGGLSSIGVQEGSEDDSSSDGADASTLPGVRLSQAPPASLLRTPTPPPTPAPPPAPPPPPPPTTGLRDAPSPHRPSDAKGRSTGPRDSQATPTGGHINAAHPAPKLEPSLRAVKAEPKEEAPRPTVKQEPGVVKQGQEGSAASTKTGREGSDPPSKRARRPDAGPGASETPRKMRKLGNGTTAPAQAVGSPGDSDGFSDGPSLFPSSHTRRGDSAAFDSPGRPPCLTQIDPSSESDGPQASGTPDSCRGHLQVLTQAGMDADRAVAAASDPPPAHPFAGYTRAAVQTAGVPAVPRPSPQELRPPSPAPPATLEGALAAFRGAPGAFQVSDADVAGSIAAAVGKECRPVPRSQSGDGDNMVPPSGFTQLPWDITVGRTDHAENSGVLKQPTAVDAMKLLECDVSVVGVAEGPTGHVAIASATHRQEERSFRSSCGGRTYECFAFDPRQLHSATLLADMKATFRICATPLPTAVSLGEWRGDGGQVFTQSLLRTLADAQAEHPQLLESNGVKLSTAWVQGELVVHATHLHQGPMIPGYDVHDVYQIAMALTVARTRGESRLRDVRSDRALAYFLQLAADESDAEYPTKRRPVRERVDATLQAALDTGYLVEGDQHLFVSLCRF